MRPDIPDFGAPPVVEVAFSLQFDALPRFTAPYIGLLWQKFRDQLPEIEEHAPLEEVFEQFGPPAPTRLDVKIEDRPPVPRVWFMNRDKTELIQVQQNRFVRNWRKLQTNKPYPRYELIKEAFEKEVGMLTSFLAEHDLGGLVLNQCELTYVNHIEPTVCWSSHSEAPAVFSILRSPEAAASDPTAEDYAFRVRHLIRGEDGRPAGRISALMSPAWKALDRTPIFIFNLIARGAPTSNDLGAAMEFFDLGRLWIVKQFADMTTKEMHHAWHRTDR